MPTQITRLGWKKNILNRGKFAFNISELTGDLNILFHKKINKTCRTIKITAASFELPQAQENFVINKISIFIVSFFSSFVNRYAIFLNDKNCKPFSSHYATVFRGLIF